LWAGSGFIWVRDRGVGDVMVDGSIRSGRRAASDYAPQVTSEGEMLL